MYYHPFIPVKIIATNLKYSIKISSNNISSFNEIPDKLSNSIVDQYKAAFN